MTPVGRRSIGIQALVVALLLPALALAGYEDSYRDGMRAAESGNWGQVIRYMRAAIAERPREGGQVRLYGQFFAPYLPHYYLGLAHFRLDDCESALREWKTSEADGVVQRSSGLYRGLSQSRGLCEQRVASARTPPPTVAPTAAPSVAAARPVPTPATAAPTPATPAPVLAAAEKAGADLRRVEASIQRIGSLASDPNLAAIWNQDPSLGPAFRNARRTLDNARTKFEEGRNRGDLGAMSEAIAQLEQIATQLEAIQSAANQASERARVARASLPTASPTAPPTPAGPPRELVAAAEAYFGKSYNDVRERYTEVLKLLQGAGLNGDDRIELQGLVLRCAARYNLYVLGGETQPDLLQQAKDDARAARRLNASYVPDTKYFSPRFVGFYQAAN